MSSVVTPEVQWAQRSSESDPEKNYLLLTISIPDCAPNPEVKIEPTCISLKATSNSNKGVSYELKIDLFKEVLPEKTLHKIANGQHYFVKLFKKDLGLEYWPRLTKEKFKYGYIKTDFNKWVDEDEQDTADHDDTFGSDMMGGQGGMPDMGGMDMGGMDMGGMDMEALQQMLAQGGAANFGG
ncbi:hypothetical protein Kpol_1033p61 [Vanderwaltozyma polyspora DSM 70294]|uniref:CS domain-containing protein n=1 Tax=Vanderwaltozyma polyspora (strain ATCC 22028 / DSM 70294 / BCRC 21397 / CBS 2163 / NBRC 10782 / NRRL Y-8283 / UCD 57-17) TaxID=436907 RepID=A7TJ55_VANPO|nr:uncharacterized protein Kpol_1033p61 [Vanderwaltozyma polyspora DSM 70294]EDO17754.1 hypothetical protein Kpol_1033p61 [Vanderwaltozyma polyspora DSM 70294]